MGGFVRSGRALLRRQFARMEKVKGLLVQQVQETNGTLAATFKLIQYPRTSWLDNKRGKSGHFIYEARNPFKSFALHGLVR